MTVRELILELQGCDPDALVYVEQTNDTGPDGVSAVVKYPHGSGFEDRPICSHVVLEGDLFQ